MRTVAKVIGTTFGSGFFPIAPGTVGSAVAAVALWFLPMIQPATLVFITAIFFFIGVWASTKCEREWGHDPGKVNWDEVVGMTITLMAVPKHWIVYLAGFFLFRFFDVLKPFPIHKLQSLPRGWGVMADDVLAAIYANVILQIVFQLIWNPFR